MATAPVEPTVTPLRQRMLDDMAMRAMKARTQHDYVRHVRTFAAFLGRSPDMATAEDIRRFQVHQREYGVSESVIAATVSTLRFLFGVTLERPDLARKLVLAPRPRKLSVDEVARLLEAAPGIKYRAALGVAYGAGLRVSEVAHLKADDIGRDDTQRLPSGDSPPPGTIMWMCGWWVMADPQVWSTAVIPIRAPRCFGSAAMVVIVSDAAWNSSPYAAALFWSAMSATSVGSVKTTWK